MSAKTFEEFREEGERIAGKWSDDDAQSYWIGWSASRAALLDDAPDVDGRITAYLACGGLFNPELANHDAVRDLLIDCRAALESLAAQNAAQQARIRELEGEIAKLKRAYERATAEALRLAEKIRAHERGVGMSVNAQPAGRDYPKE